MSQQPTEHEDAWAGLGQGFAQAEVVVAEHEPDALEPVDDERAHIRRLRGLENELLERAIGIVGDSLRFAEIDDPYAAPPPENEAQTAQRAEQDLSRLVEGKDPLGEIPEAWVQELGMERARQRMRLARAGWKPIKDAPIAFKIATQTFTGIVKARATEKSAPVRLNIGTIQLSAPLPVFERRKELPK